MGVVRKIGDGLRNLVSNLGTPRDKAASSYYAAPNLTDADVLNAYRGAWLPRKVIAIPAQDACRNWRSWQADQAEITKLEAEEKRLGLQGKLLECLIKARAWGGAAIYIGTGDRDPSLPLDPARIGVGGIKHLNVVTRRMLTANEIERDPESPLYGRPKSYQLNSQNAGIVTIHPSRLVVLIGAEHPDQELATGIEAGWGDSVLTAIIDQIKQADGTAANVASLIFEAKVDVISIPNLMANITDPAFEQQLLERLTLAATAKGINGALILDSAEEYEQKQASFASLRDLVLAFMQLVAGASDIPMTRLLGQSPAGLGGNGDHDTRNYYDAIASLQSLKLTPAMEVLDECLIRSALGSRPEEVFYNWRSLWQPTEKERADIGKTTADTIKTLNDTKLIPDEVMQTTAVNMLTEAGVAPGLESELKDWLAANPEGDESEEDDLASMGGAPALGPDGQPLDPEAAAAAAAEEAAAAELADTAPRSLYVRRDVVNTAEIAAWAESQGIADLLEGLHVTIAYSRQPIDWIKAGNAKEWGEDGKDKLTIAEGGPRAVEPLGGMSAVLLFASSQLTWRHAEILRAGATYDWADYQPHISLTKTPIDLSKVEPYRGQIVLGPEIFEELRED